MEDDFTKDLAEFLWANAIYSTLVEDHACEWHSVSKFIFFNVVLPKFVIHI